MSLAAYACHPAQSRGRRHAEPPAPTRDAFQRDRDRIVHSTAFRRLVYKTQVFLNHEGDLFRTRLTHSLEVAQLGRSIARALRINEDLVEAIALAHDLGHTPFGHAGQDALNACMADHGGFELKEQLKTHLRNLGHSVRDLGTNSKDPVDYRLAMLDGAGDNAGGAKKLANALRTAVGRSGYGAAT